MLKCVSRYSTMAALVLASSAQAALAHEHSAYAHHGLYRPYLAYRAHAYGRYFARHYRPRYYAYARFASQRETGYPQTGYTQQPRFGGFADQDFGQSARRRFGSEASTQASAYEGMVASAAGANGVPVTLVHRVIMRESGYNARATSRGNYGIMQIRLGTARAMGYSGSAAGLLDPATNVTYAVRYLAGAYRAAGGNESRAVALYSRGYNAGRARAAGPDTSFAATSPSWRLWGDYQPPYRGVRVAAYRVRHHRYHPV